MTLASSMRSSAALGVPGLDLVAADLLDGLRAQAQVAITGMLARAIASTTSASCRSTSILTQLQPPSISSLPALRTASSLLIWYDRYGMSPIRNALGAPRRTAAQTVTIMSIVTGRVESMPRTT